MENILKVPEDLENYEYGQMFRVNTPLGKDIAVYNFKYEDIKYPISDKTGQRSRSLGRQDDGKIKFITPEEEGGKPDDTHTRYELLGYKGAGTYSYVEGDTRIANWKFEPIDETDPDFDPEFQKGSKMMSDIFSKLTEKFSLENGKDENIDISSIFKDLL